MKQLNILRTAIMFYSRIPVGSIKSYSDDMLSKSTRFFPVVGFIVGSLTALVYWLFSQILPNSIAILLSMAFSIYLTGAFHEDGFADFCDGFGGGYTKEKVLTIMKDSRIGTYGTVGLLLILGAKFLALSYISPLKIMVVLIAGHTFSRLWPVVLLYFSAYVRENDDSKSKPIGKKDSLGAFIFSIISGLVPIILIPSISIAYYFAIMLVIFFVFKRYITKKIGGYTGDVLGAFQQLSEICFYIVIVAYNY